MRFYGSGATRHVWQPLQCSMQRLRFQLGNRQMETIRGGGRGRVDSTHLPTQRPGETPRIGIPNEGRVETMSRGTLRSEPIHRSWHLSSILSGHDGSRDRLQKEFFGFLTSFLEPGEIVLAHSSCLPLRREQTDAIAYTAGGSKDQTDALNYAHSERGPQTDGFTYDIERGSLQQDIMGYHGGGKIEDTDAFAYPRVRPNPQTDAFMSPATSRPTVHLLVLTNRRLIRGRVDEGKLILTEAPIPAGGMSLPSSMLLPTMEEWWDRPAASTPPLAWKPGDPMTSASFKEAVPRGV